jgi:polysaccharide export outer membrane protein
MRLGVIASLVLASLSASVQAQWQDAYRVGPKDVLGISVWGHAELSGKYTVAADGSLSFPLIGSVKAAKLTVSEIEAEIVSRLADGYLRKPQVSVEIAEYLSQRVFVIGEVRSPGPIVLTGSTTLLEALARAGSMTEQAGGEVVILRPRSGQSAAGPLPLGQDDATELGRVGVQQLRSGSISVNVPLRDGDTIFVPRAETIYVLGNVNNPGAYTIESGVTTVLRAISLAGGMSQLGSTRRVRITRIVNGRKVELKATLDDLLKPGDIVTVRTRLF